MPQVIATYKPKENLTIELTAETLPHFAFNSDHFTTTTNTISSIDISYVLDYDEEEGAFLKATVLSPTDLSLPERKIILDEKQMAQELYNTVYVNNDYVYKNNFFTNKICVLRQEVLKLLLILKHIRVNNYDYKGLGIIFSDSYPIAIFDTLVCYDNNIYAIKNVTSIFNLNNVINCSIEFFDLSYKEHVTGLYLYNIKQNDASSNDDFVDYNITSDTTDIRAVVSMTRKLLGLTDKNDMIDIKTTADMSHKEYIQWGKKNIIGTNIKEENEKTDDDFLFL